MRAPGFFAATLKVVGQSGFLPAKATFVCAGWCALKKVKNIIYDCPSYRPALYLYIAQDWDDPLDQWPQCGPDWLDGPRWCQVQILEDQEPWPREVSGWHWWPIGILNKNKCQTHEGIHWFSTLPGSPWLLCLPGLVKVKTKAKLPLWTNGSKRTSSEVSKRYAALWALNLFQSSSPSGFKLFVHV